MRPALALLLAFPLFAGCLAEPASPLDPSALLGARPGYAYSCPGEEDADLLPCLVPLSSQEEHRFEPFVAAHPTDPRVWAVGYNVGTGLRDLAAGLPDGSASITRLGVAVTEDGGRTWRTGHLPKPSFGVEGPNAGVFDIVGDPALVWDAQGRLHALGLANLGNLEQTLVVLGLAAGDSGVRVFYTSSDDRGTSWSPPRVLDDNGLFQDREWLALGPSGELFAVWQNVGDPVNLPRSERTVQVAWSLDRGATWRTQGKDQLAPCARAGTPAFHQGTLLFACDRFEGDTHTGFAVHAFDPATGASRLRAEIPEDGNWPGLNALASGRLVLHHDRCFDVECEQDTHVRWSDDGGATWSAPASLRAMAGEGWQHAKAFWVEPDGQGMLHVLLALARDEPSALPPLGTPVTGQLTPAVRIEEWHLVLDASLAPVHRATLLSWSTHDPGAARAGIPLGGDHFHGLAWNGPRGLLAVAHDGGLLVGALEATGAPRPAQS